MHTEKPPIYQPVVCIQSAAESACLHSASSVLHQLPCRPDLYQLAVWLLDTAWTKAHRHIPAHHVYNHINTNTSTFLHNMYTTISMHNVWTRAIQTMTTWHFSRCNLYVHSEEKNPKTETALCFKTDEQLLDNMSTRMPKDIHGSPWRHFG